MGDKAQARTMAKQAGAPVVPGSEGPLDGPDEAEALADDIGYPVMVKAAAGGGGRGMRIVRDAASPGPRLRHLPGGGGRRLRRLGALPREVRRGSPPRRGPGARRQERHARAPRRARLLGPAAAPEAPRGVAGAVDLRGDAGGPRARPRSPWPTPSTTSRRAPWSSWWTGRAVLLHRDEHAHPGRAPRHRDGHRPRPGPRADPHRRRGALGYKQDAIRFAGHAIECRDQRRGPRALRALARPRHAVAAARRARRPRGQPPRCRATRCRPTTTR